MEVARRGAARRAEGRLPLYLATQLDRAAGWDGYPEERLSVDRLVSDLQAAGRQAEHIPGTEAIVERMARSVEPGDVVVIMSNGGFDGIHRKLASALRHAPLPRTEVDA